jgi:hypothetical protein
MVDCSKCTNRAEHHIVVRNKEPKPEPGQVDVRGMRIVRLCEGCWSELEVLLPTA